MLICANIHQPEAYHSRVPSQTNKTPARKAATGEALTPEAAAVLRQFRVIFNSVRKHFRAIESRVHVSGAHVWALGIIAQHPGIRVNDLAAAMEVHQSTASNLVRKLTADRLAVSERGEADKRHVHLFASTAGVRLLKKAPLPYSGVLPNALLALDQRTLARLRKDLSELIRVLSPREDGAAIPLGQRDE
jgi:DNA-binding MarR family transcriptional regulator